MRPIDADKLIRKYIDTDIEKFSNSDVKIVLENLKQNILKAPSIDIPAWIPNEQRLPKYNKRVLICTEDGDIYIGYRSRLLRKGGEPMDCMRDMDGYPIVCPDAWMQLPEPYHGGEEQ